MLFKGLNGSLASGCGCHCHILKFWRQNCLPSKPQLIGVSFQSSLPAFCWSSFRFSVGKPIWADTLPPTCCNCLTVSCCCNSETKHIAGSAYCAQMKLTCFIGFLLCMRHAVTLASLIFCAPLYALLRYASMVSFCLFCFFWFEVSCGLLRAEEGPRSPLPWGRAKRESPNLTEYFCYGIKRRHNWPHQELISHISSQYSFLSNTSNKLIFTRPFRTKIRFM